MSRGKLSKIFLDFTGIYGTFVAIMAVLWVNSLVCLYVLCYFVVRSRLFFLACVRTVCANF